MSGLFISFEGGDGAGKSTQVERLAAALRGQGYDVRVTREPGGTELGAQIRQALLHGGDVAPRAEALLFAADRAHHVASLVRPALAAGAIVVTDRYLDSSVAYQGAARSLGAQEVRDLSLWAVEGLLPKLTVLLDVPVEAGSERVGEDRDRLESAGDDFHARVRAEFLALADAEPSRFLVLNARDSRDAIEARIFEAVAPLLADADLSRSSAGSESGDPAEATK